MTLPVTALTAAICAIMILITAIATVRERMRLHAVFGDGDGDHKLTSAMRSHANLTEHAPIVVIMIGVLEMADAHHWTLTGIAVTFLASRVLHIIGMYGKMSATGVPLPRQIGVVGTWITMSALIGWILYYVLTVNA